MHSTKFVVLLAGAVAAQSTVTVINFYPADSTLTFKSSDSKATTYEVVCPASATDVASSAGAASSAAPSELLCSFTSGRYDCPEATPTDLQLTPTSAPTAKARLRRQDDIAGQCEPYTIIQGASTWEMHLTDPVPGAWTVNANCNWSGELTAVDVTCTGSQEGSIVQTPGSDTTTWKAGELASFSALQTATVVSASTSGGSSSGNSAVSPTSTGKSSGSPTAGASQSAQSTGIAPAGPLPTGAMVFVGGAAGLFAAALAL